MSALAPDQSHRYFFVHITKTGGTAFRRQLIDYFGATAVYPTWELDGFDWVKLYLSSELLRDRLAARGDQIRVITGHYTLRAVEEIEGPLITMTLLRDPVERVLSYLRSTVPGPADPQPERSTRLEEAYEKLRGIADNNMTKVLSLTPAQMRASIFARADLTRDDLERAKEGLAGIDVIGIQENFEDFCHELNARFGWRLGEPKRVNTSPPADVPEELRARIAEDNPLDRELYEFAQELLRDAGRPFERRQATAVGR